MKLKDGVGKRILEAEEAIGVGVTIAHNPLALDISPMCRRNLDVGSNLQSNLSYCILSVTALLMQ